MKYAYWISIMMPHCLYVGQVFIYKTHKHICLLTGKMHSSGYSDLGIYILYLIEDAGGSVEMATFTNILIRDTNSKLNVDRLFYQANNCLRHLLEDKMIEIGREAIIANRFQLKPMPFEEALLYFPIESYFKFNLEYDAWQWNKELVGTDRLCFVITKAGLEFIETFAIDGINESYEDWHHTSRLINPY